MDKQPLAAPPPPTRPGIEERTKAQEHAAMDPDQQVGNLFSKRCARPVMFIEMMTPVGAKEHEESDEEDAASDP